MAEKLGKMGRMVELEEELSAAAGSVHALTKKAMAVLNVWVVASGAAKTPVYAGTAPAATQFAWDPKANTITFNGAEGDGGAARITYLAEAVP